MEVLDEVEIQAPVEVPDPVSLLLRLAAVTVRRGWCQGTLHDSYGNHCLVDALYVNNDGDFDKMFYLAFTRLVKVLRTPFVASWNDQPGRTKEEVIVALECAAAIGEEHGIRTR